MAACKSSCAGRAATLLRRAQDAGAVRADTQIGDLLKLTYAIVQATEPTRRNGGCSAG